jgi:Cu/Ag efflux protein CusF
MKMKAIALALFVAGASASYAVAGDGHGNGKGSDDSTTTAATSTTTKDATHGGKKVTLCHKAGKSGKWVKVTVSKNAAKSKLKHGDVAPDASGKCPASTPPVTTGETTTVEKTTATP